MTDQTSAPGPGELSRKSARKRGGLTNPPKMKLQGTRATPRRRALPGHCKCDVPLARWCNACSDFNQHPKQCHDCWSTEFVDRLLRETVRLEPIITDEWLKRLADETAFYENKVLPSVIHKFPYGVTRDDLREVFAEVIDHDLPTYLLNPKNVNERENFSIARGGVAKHLTQRAYRRISLRLKARRDQRQRNREVAADAACRIRPQPVHDGGPEGSLGYATDPDAWQVYQREGTPDTRIQRASAVLHIIMTHLPSRQRRVIDCIYWQNMTQVETAKVVGRSERTVRNEHRVALAWLKARIMERVGGLA